MGFHYSDFYNHKSQIKSANEGTILINNTDFNKYHNDRLQASRQFKIGDTIDSNMYKGGHDLYTITEVTPDSITAYQIGDKKRIERFFNPVHVTKFN